MKKYIWLIAGTTLCLFFIGLLMGPFVLKYTEMILGKEAVGKTPSDFLVPPVSLGLLLAFCSIGAGCLLWAYSRKNSRYAPELVFGCGLLVSLLSAMIAVGSKLLYIHLAFRYAFHFLGDTFDNLYLEMGGINYFSWGFGLTLFVNAVIIVMLLWASRERREQKDNNASVYTN